MDCCRNAASNLFDHCAIRMPFFTEKVRQKCAYPNKNWLVCLTFCSRLALNWMLHSLNLLGNWLLLSRTKVFVYLIDTSQYCKNTQC